MLPRIDFIRKLHVVIREQYKMVLRDSAEVVIELPLAPSDPLYSQILSKPNPP